ncbi:phosphatidylinositol transporter, putative [Paecilomyces variotii No. 5]|uniref:Phosphatidylinositol transporter, putative n=1 Tax=Byssochlamys spectabilis (strain No. 5 / NBRC 109023) TaxID=1356009 RepID=V5FTN2_BYSSN|nr:phosphatidylinositol transporter, putative [Paecilomyces variotii No. 5]
MGLWRTSSRKSQKSSETSTPEDQSPDAHTPTSRQDPNLDRSLSRNDPEASARQANSEAWLAGHLHHLTPEQEDSLQRFKKLCEEKGYYTPAKEGEEEGKATHDDATLLRFLRARKFDVNAAFQQFKDTEEWRKDNKIEALYENIDIESYDEARRMYPQWTGRRDLRGIPVYVFAIRHLDSKAMAAYTSKVSQSTTAETHKSSTVPARLLRLFALYENLLRFVMPLCSQLPRPNPETPIVSSTNIVDVSGVGLRQFWNLKGHMQDASVLATAHYPETLDRIFLIGAPSFFPTVWGWIKRWFDPNTTSKIFILSADEVKPTLTSFMPLSSIPKKYGGELDWDWGDLPSLDEPARELIGALETSPANGQGKPGFLKGPVLFKGDKIEVLGSEGGRPRRQEIPVEKKTSSTGNGDIAAAAAAADEAAAPTTNPLPSQDEDEKAALEKEIADGAVSPQATTTTA